MLTMKTSITVAFLMAASAAGPVSAATCGNSGEGFQQWVQAFKSEAQAQGVSARTADAALANVSYDRRLIAFDRSQKVFKQSFEQFSARMASNARVNGAKARMARYGAVLQRTEQRTGVPAAVILAIWGLETDFGQVQGKKPVFNGLATLAYDCRRTEMFQRELISAMKIVDRGDLSLSEMRGAAHGELGQAQFLPSSYIKFGTDGDGDGRRDLVRSGADTIASIGTYLQGHGWRAGAGWEEGSANFSVFNEWNRSTVYQRTIALLATKIAAATGSGR